MLWMEQFLGELGIKQEKYVFQCDSQRKKPRISL